MTSTAASCSTPRRWQPLLDPAIYDLSPTLSPWECRALKSLTYRDHGRTRTRRLLPGNLSDRLRRLLTPIEDVLNLTQIRYRGVQHNVAPHLLRAVHQFQAPYFVWSREQWLATIRQSPPDHGPGLRAVAHLVAGKRDLHAALSCFDRRHFAQTVLSRDAVENSVRRVEDEMASWGYGSKGTILKTRIALCDLMLRCGSPLLEDLTPEAIATFYDSGIPKTVRHGTRQLVRMLVETGVLDSPPIAIDSIGRPKMPTPLNNRSPGVPTEWANWCQRWLNTSTLGPNTRQTYYYDLLKVGRWLADQHPDVTNPAGWTRELAADWVAAVNRMVVGDWSQGVETAAYRRLLGSPLSARTKAGHTCILRTFFRDCQDWGWIPTRFDPTRALATPRSVYALIGPKPRVIADDIWAKLLWAGLNLTADDLPRNRVTRQGIYPLELVRAVTLLWLFTGLRANEIARLPVGCIRWQHQDGGAAASEPRDSDTVCLLDVPVHKTGTAFTKPVDRSVGDAIAVWEALRPTQPQLLDEKTGEMVDYLFVWRHRRMSISFINRTVIQALCRKANVPPRDARGAITSHRARSTIATQLYNAKDPMTLFELQAWLGHRSPNSTQHYAKITPTTLTKAYTDAGYFARNIRAIKVLVDRDAVQSGAAASGTPWQHFDLGHGYCTYDFFEQCPHRMACARCEFYVPKTSTKAQLLESKANLQRMLVEIPLLDDERAAVEDGGAAVDRLLERLADVPTPAAPMPKAPAPARPLVMLPLVNATSRHAPSGADAAVEPVLPSDLRAAPRSEPR
jgi:integrase